MTHNLLESPIKILRIIARFGLARRLADAFGALFVGKSCLLGWHACNLARQEGEIQVDAAHESQKQHAAHARHGGCALRRPGARAANMVGL